jgi:hypothetical protein
LKLSARQPVDGAPKAAVDRYISEFERLLDDVARDERGPAAMRSHLVSRTRRDGWGNAACPIGRTA